MEEEGDDTFSKPNPNGFFPNFTGTDACSVAVALRVRPLVGRELTEGNRKICINQPDDTPATKLLMGSKSFTFDQVFWAEDS